MKDYQYNWDVIWRSVDDLLYGLWLDVYMAFFSVLAGSVIGLVVAFALVSKQGFIRRIAQIYVTMIRNIPLMIIVLFIYFIQKI